jgi:hypothetical protein
MTQIAAELDRMRFEVYKIQKDLRKREEMSNAMVHLLVESGVVPGKDTACRCGVQDGSRSDGRSRVPGLDPRQVVGEGKRRMIEFGMFDWAWPVVVDHVR